MRCGKLVAIPLVFAAAFILFCPKVEAQKRHYPYRHPVRPAVRVYGGFYGPHFGFYYGRPWYGPWYGSWYGPWYPYAYNGLYGPGYYARSSVRIQVKPVETEVFVDGYYAGVVDQYDGFFQRLHLPPGEHEIELYLEGYRTVRENLYLNSGDSYKIQHEMEPLAPGEAGEPRPEPKDYEGPPEVGSPGPQLQESQGPPPSDTAGLTQESAPHPVQPSRFGELTLRTQPGEVEILIDGESWPYSGEADGMVIHLPAGRHRVEIRRDGYEPFAAEVEVRAGETTTLYVKLPPQGSRAD